MIDYKNSLNPAQYAAATAKDGPVLVIAGAGSGKTRTIVYRLAWLAEQGVDPNNMLLLTFTRKAAQEMLKRASLLLERGLMGVRGGTFHAFAYSILRQYRPAWLEDRHFSIMDNADITAAIRHCREELGVGKGDRSFPKSQNIVGILSKARNKEISIDEVLQREANHLLPHADALQAINVAYTNFRRSQGLLDYDDLLFELENLLQEDRESLQFLRQGLQHIMVDEYQDTNLVQARLVRLLGAKEYGGHGNVMAVGDDAQSIYAFRGANVRNILDFPNNFPQTNIIRLEENYRSTQPVLNVANTLLSHAKESFEKELFTRREGGSLVRMVTPHSDKSQADVVTRRIIELLESYLPHEIAVLFRAGFHSYNLEIALNRAGIKFRKYGGLRFADAAHIKDVLSYARLLVNPLDMPAFERVAMLHKGIGKKTMQKLYAIAIKADATATQKSFAKYPDFLQDMQFLDYMRSKIQSPSKQMEAIIDHYQPRLEATYPDDWPRRRQGLDETLNMAANATHLDLFIADLVLDTVEDEDVDEQCIILSTVHSAKGLEWSAVLVIDLVEERFPSRHALNDAESFEEERRLMYVACTRAKQHLELYAPSSVNTRGSMGSIYASPSPFLRELPHGMCEEWFESYGKVLQKRKSPNSSLGFMAGQSLLPPANNAQKYDKLCDDNDSFEPSTSMNQPVTLGYCQHKIFGRGKMIKFLPPDKYQVNFAGFGLKVIMKDFLTLES